MTDEFAHRSDEFAVATELRPGFVVLETSGELDFLTVPVLREAFDAALSTSPRSSVVLDFARLHFIDSSGLAALLSMDRALEASGGYLVVATQQHQVLRTVAAAGLGERLPIAGSVDAAIAMIG